MEKVGGDYPAKHKYFGEAASKYDLARQTSGQWLREDEIITDVLRRFPADCRVADIPVGTGRFFPQYSKFGIKVVAVDISPDMLDEARSKTDQYGIEPEWLVSEAENLPLADDSVHSVVCIRLLNWVPLDTVKLMLAEFDRVAEHNVVFGIRVIRPMTRMQWLGDLTRDVLLNRIKPSWLLGYVRGRLGRVRNALFRRKTSAPVKARLEDEGWSAHPESEILAMLELLDLGIVERHTVNTHASRSTRQYSQYFVFVAARKEATSRSDAPPQQPARVIEIAGLSGAGKSTAGDILSHREGPGAQTKSVRFRRLLQRSGLNRLLLPRTAIRYRSLLWAYRQRQHPGSRVPRLLWISVFAIRAMLAKPNPNLIYENPTLELALGLNELEVAQLLAGTEARLRSKTVVTTNGYVQRAIGIWMRAEADLKQDYLERYLKAIPGGVHGVIVDCPPEIALDRAIGRSETLHPLLRYVQSVNKADDALISEYRGVSELLRSNAFDASVTVQRISSEEEPDDQAQALDHALRNAAPDREFIWW